MDEFTDNELQWFHGGVKVEEVVHVLPGVMDCGGELVCAYCGGFTDIMRNHAGCLCGTVTVSEGKRDPEEGVRYTQGGTVEYRRVFLTPDAYINAHRDLGSIWSQQWDCHRQPRMLSGEVYECPTCTTVSDLHGECVDCYFDPPQEDTFPCNVRGCDNPVAKPTDGCDECLHCGCMEDDCFWCAPEVDMYADYCACGENGYKTCVCGNVATDTAIPF